MPAVGRLADTQEHRLTALAAELTRLAAALESRMDQVESRLDERLQDVRAATHESLEQLRAEADKATRRGDLQKAAEISYGRIPALERDIAAREKKLQEIQKSAKYLKEEVEAEDIAEIVAKWTGIPVTKMLESERERLTRLEAELGRRVVGQPEALAAINHILRDHRANEVKAMADCTVAGRMHR